MTKCGVVKKDWRGFDTIVTRAKEHINRNGVVIILYVKGSGFVPRRKLSEKVELLMMEGEVIEVGTYDGRADYDGMVDDCIFVLDQVIRRVA